MAEVVSLEPDIGIGPRRLDAERGTRLSYVAGGWLRKL
jgi:hypothetical protein